MEGRTEILPTRDLLYRERWCADQAAAACGGAAAAGWLWRLATETASRGRTCRQGAEVSGHARD